MSSISEIIVNIGRLAKEKAERVVALVAEEVQKDAIKRAGVHNKTNRMINSIRMRKIPDGYEVAVGGSVAPYAKYVHDGRKPGVITGHPMHFFWNGKEIFTHRVKHPGYKGDPFLRDAANDVRSRIAQIAGRIK